MNAFKQEKLDLKMQKDKNAEEYRERARESYLANRRRSEANKQERLNNIAQSAKFGRDGQKEQQRALRMQVEEVRNQIAMDKQRVVSEMRIDRER